MKRAVMVGVCASLTVVIANPGAAQIPAQGLTALVCLAGVQGNGTYVIGPSGRLVMEVSGDTGSSATVKITHGGDDSTHVLRYLDVNESGVLDCGDRIISVT